MTLNPAFDSSVLEYTATTSNATNKVTATPADPYAEITIMLGDNVIENGGSAAWETGENDLVITVHGYPDTVYTVTVTAE